MPTVEEVQKDLEKANTTFAADHEAIKKRLDEQEAEIKKFGETASSTAAKLTEDEKRYDEHGTAIEALKKELTEQVGQATKLATEARASLEEIEKAAQRPGWPGVGAGGEAIKFLGDQLVEFMEANKSDFEALAAGSRRASQLPALVLKGFEGQPAFMGYSPGEVKKALSSTMTTNFAPVLQVPGYIAMPRRRLRMRDLIPTVPTTAPAIRYLRQTGFTTAAAGATVTIARSGTVATVTHTGHGFSDFDLVAIAGADQAAYNGNKRITLVDANSYTFTVAGAPVTPATGTITAKRLTNWGAATFVAEGAAKPEADMSWEERIAYVQVIAHFIKATRQVFDDVPGLRANVDGDLLYGLLFREDAALLYGTGVSPQIQGIMLEPGAQSYAWSQGITGDKKEDALRRSRTLVELALREASGAVIHPRVWEEIETRKATDGQYIWVRTMNALNPQGEDVWRMPLVVTPSIRYEQFLVGDFGTGATLYDREQANIRFSDSDQDDFIKNRVTILAEERLAAAWKNPEAFVVGSFDAAPA